MSFYKKELWFKKRNRGQAVIVSVLFLVLIAMTLATRGTRPVQTEATLARDLFLSKKASALSDAGTEDLVYRIKNANTYDTLEYVLIDGLTVTTTVATNAAGEKVVNAIGNAAERIRTKAVSLVLGDQVSFNYGMQAGTGGITMANSASILGNVYSNGAITGSGNTVYGDVVSAGPSGLVRGVYATGTVYAHTIESSTIDRNAYYQVKTGSTVGGTSYPGSSDLPLSDFPISDSQIADWEADAAAGGTISSPCPYVITSPITLGPKKINCDMQVKGTTLTVSGPIWVNGNLSFTNAFHVKLSSSLATSSIMMIADKTGSPLTAGTISVSNSGDIVNNGVAGTALYLISGNTSAQNGGGVTAIDMGNGVDNDAALYSNHGKITINQSGKLYMATGYQINLSQSAQIIYRSGIANSIFNTGPGASWNLTGWKETQ